MGQRVMAGTFPAPFMALSWHEQPYAARSDCWGCGLPTDLVAPVFHGLPMMPGRRPPRLPQCTWCTELAEILEILHDRKWRRRGYSPPPRKPSRPPRGTSGISPSKDGSR